MKRFCFSHLAGHLLRRDIVAAHASECSQLADQLARIAEFDDRELWRQEKYDSMFTWCIGVLGLSEATAYKRIRLARAGREFPAVFEALASGQVNLNTALLLAPHLTPGNVAGLLASAARQPRATVEHLIAERFPRPDAPTIVESVAVAMPVPPSQPSLPTNVEASSCQLAARLVAPSEVPSPTGSTVPEFPTPSASALEPRWPRVTELSPGHFRYQFMLRQAAHEKLGYAKALLGHAVPTGNLPEIIERALDALIERLERTKLGKRSRTRPAVRRRGGSNPCLEPNERYVPDRVKNVVWERDGGRCTFVGSDGKRCDARSRLEFDHVTAVARGGLSTIENMRLRCRAHNQLEAERTFGTAFMKGKRERASRAGRKSRGDDGAAAPVFEPAHPEIATRALESIRAALDEASGPGSPARTP